MLTAALICLFLIGFNVLLSQARVYISCDIWPGAPRLAELTSSEGIPAALVLDGKKLAAFAATAGRFLRFPIGDRRCNGTRASAGKRPVTRACARPIRKLALCRDRRGKPRRPEDPGYLQARSLQ